ncbi:MAG: flagellar motor switch protein FliM [Bacillota bacterium]|nr:flagellar motor switch protein FliM [Bacillota bacterium]
MEVLSQKEVDDLLQALASGKLGGQPAQREGPVIRPTVRVYDFRRPDKFSKDHLRTLQMVHENFARVWTTVLSAHLRTMARVTLDAVEQLTYGEFLTSVRSPSVLCLVSMEPLPGRQMVDVHPALAFPLIDRLLGGLGAGEAGERALTDIEVTVMERVFGGMLSALAEAWQGLVALKPRLDSIETNPLFAQVIPPNEVAAVITFTAMLGETGGSLRLCLPYSSLKSVLGQLTSHRWAGGGEIAAPASNGANLQDVRVDMSVRLGKATLTIGQLLNLERGDVVRLGQPVGEPLTVYLGTRPAFRVRPGRVGNRAAVQVVKVLAAREAEDDE